MSRRNRRFGCPHYETGHEAGEYWITSIGPDKRWQIFCSEAKTCNNSNGLLAPETCMWLNRL